MGIGLRVFSQRNVIAVIVGVLLAAVPLIAFDFWLNGLIDRQGQAEVAAGARRATTLVNARLGMVVEALDGLAANGVTACTPATLDAMRQAAFTAMPIKEVAIVGPNGQTLCSHLSISLGPRSVIASGALKGGEGYVIELVQLGSGAQMVRLRRSLPNGNAVTALVPPALFLPQVSVEGSPFSAYAQVATAEGAIVSSGGVRPAADDPTFAASVVSEKYGVEVSLSAPRALVPASHIGVHWIGVLLVGAMIAALAVFAWQMPRRRTGNPVADIEHALANGEFVPYYQPIVDIRSGQLRGAEVLVRWRKPDGSLVMPGAFIPLAESSGLICEMTHDLMRRVCVEAGAALGRRPGLKISFNFAGQLFSDPAIVKDVRKIFSASPIKLSQVVLELTERDPIENFTVTRQVIAALQGLGVRIAIDDVGTGHSGLSYMLKLGVDIIKIDKMFVDAIGTDRNSTTIVETLVDLAHNMRMDVVAEGVENFEQVMHLRDLGIRSAQGYVFAPPLPGSAFLQLVEAIDPIGTAAAPAEPPALAQTA